MPSRSHSISNPAHLHQVGDSVRQRGNDVGSSTQRVSMPGQGLGPLGAGTASHIDGVLGDVHSSGQAMSSRMTHSGDTLHANASAFEQNESDVAHSFSSIQPPSHTTRTIPSSAGTTTPSSAPLPIQHYNPATNSFGPNAPAMPPPRPPDNSVLPYHANPTDGRQGDMFTLPPSQPGGYTPNHANVVPGPYGRPYDVQTPASMEYQRPPNDGSRPPHNASATVYGPGGQVTSPTTYWTSGGMTPEQQALGYPTSSLSTHTEQQAIRYSGIQDAMGPGSTLHIQGQYPPCGPCQAGMTTFAAQSGGHVQYSYPDPATGDPRTWSSQAHINNPAQWNRYYGYTPQKPV